MNEYHKIQTVFKRDPATKYKTLLMGEYALPEFQYLQSNRWIWTEKVDGANIRIMYEDGKIAFGGRTAQAQILASLVNALQELVGVKVLSEVFPDGAVCLYGEGYGAKIQKGGGNYRPDQSFVLFDVKVGDIWLKREDVEDVAVKLNLDVVPIIGEGTLDQMVSFVRNGFNSHWGDFKAEGVVARPKVELQTRMGQRIITKLKCKDFQAD